MESNDTPAWMAKAPQEERLCWSFLWQGDWLSGESAWAAAAMDPNDTRARAWALGPLAKLSDLEEFREARMLARMLIWESLFGKADPASPYAGGRGKAIAKMFDEAFARKMGSARAQLFESQAATDLVPLAKALGHVDVDPKDLARLAKLRSYENVAPESASASYIGALAGRFLEAEAELLALRFLSPKVSPGKGRG